MISKLKPKSEFTKNVLTLMTGTTIAQAIPIAISPILTRLYTPHDFGVWALYISILMIFGNLVAGKYELAILVPKHDIEAKTIVLLSLLFAVIFSTILFILVFIFHSEILKVLKNDDISFWLYILPLNIFLVSAISILYFWNNRKKKYRLLAKNQMLQSSSQGVVNLGIGFFNKINSGLIIGTLSGHIISFLFILKHTKKDLVLNFSKLKLFYVVKKYKKFPLFMLPSGLLENVSAQLPIFFLSSFFGTNIVGFYSLSQRIVRVPLMLIGTSIGNVFRQEASEHLNKYGKCEKVFLNTLKKLFIISILPFIIFFFIAPNLFELIFGEKWRVAGVYAQILTPLFYLQFITNPLSNMFIVAQKQIHHLVIRIYLIISIPLSFIITHYFNFDIKETLQVFAIVYSIKYILELYFSYKFSKGLK